MAQQQHTSHEQWKKIDIQDLDIYDDFASSKNSKDQDWDFPTFIVASNQERMDIIRVQAQKWALKHKTYVIKWKNKVTKWANKPTGRDLEKAFQNNNFMWQYFVKDAPAFIKQNINTNLGLANGTEATQHSLTFCDDHQSKQLEEILSGPNPPPYGTEIELDAPPYSVNLEIKFSKEESFLSHVQKQQRLLLKNTLSLTQDIRQSSLSQKIQGEEKTPRDTTYCQLHKTSHYPMQIFSLTFQLHWAFAVTVNLSQGRTISKVVVSLSSPPSTQSILRFKYSSFFVALSRVQKASDMRFLYKEKTDTRH
jgi:hypothetical protein